MPAPWRRQYGDARYNILKLSTGVWVIDDRRSHLYKPEDIIFPQGFRVFDTFDDIIVFMREHVHNV